MVYVLYILNGYVNKKCTIFGFTCPLRKLESMDNKLTQLRTGTIQLSTHDMSLHAVAPGVTLVQFPFNMLSN